MPMETLLTHNNLNDPLLMNVLREAGWYMGRDFPIDDWITAWEKEDLF